ncbi:MAG: PIN domain-containing protein [Chitinivibrionales bacterium]|nr:PIN domain-containing protein [Chitinivibrionales bacterium]
MRQRIYVESTVWYQMVNYADSEFKDMARQLFSLIEEERYEIFISNVVLEEISFNSKKYRARLEELIGRYKPAVLVQNADVDDIASAYVENAFRHRERTDVLADAQHAATATVANISYIASYNYRNLLSVRALEHFNAVNLLAGYNHFLSIVPPFMFLDLASYNGEKGAISDKVWTIKASHGKKLAKLEKNGLEKRLKHHRDTANRAAKKLGLQTVSLGG